MSGWTRRFRRGRALLFFLALCVCLWWASETQIGLPPTIHMMLGQAHALHPRLPVTVRATDGSGARSLTIANRGLGLSSLALDGAHPVAVVPTRVGRLTLDVRLFGLVPLRRRVVEVLPEVRVVPGGHAIGVLVAPHGMIVTGLSVIEGVDGRESCPAREAGVRVGDLVTQIDGSPVYTAQQVEYLVNRRNGAPVTLRIKRDGENLSITVPPVLSDRAQGAAGLGNRAGSSILNRRRYRLGVYVDDPAAGVGTLSFFDPASGVYGALGHMITDALSRRGADVSDGRIVPAVIAGIQRGLRGQPGEKIGVFQSQGPELGTIDRNCQYGIFGRIRRLPTGGGVPIPVALADEVAIGPAYILTVIQDQRVDRFAVEITRVARNGRPSSKGLVLKIVDQRLIARTGGIIQGMSGSPIIQQNKLIGVVTHVFVNDPTRGYGVLAEWMVEEAGLFASKSPVSQSSPSHLAKEEMHGNRRIVD